MSVAEKKPKERVKMRYLEETKPEKKNLNLFYTPLNWVQIAFLQRFTILVQVRGRIRSITQTTKSS